MSQVTWHKKHLKNCTSISNTNVRQAPMSLMDYLSLPENKDANMVMPLTWCPHLETLNEDPITDFSIQAPCKDCANVGENW